MTVALMWWWYLNPKAYIQTCGRTSYTAEE